MNESLEGEEGQNPPSGVELENVHINIDDVEVDIPAVIFCNDVLGLTGLKGLTGLSGSRVTHYFFQMLYLTEEY